MKKLLMLAVFVVTWNSWYAKEHESTYILSFNGSIQPEFEDSDSKCDLVENPRRKEFATKAEAERFAEDVAKDRKNWDVKVWKMEEAR